MAAIHDRFAQIGDERLRERLTADWATATRERKFGLVFENQAGSDRGVLIVSIDQHEVHHLGMLFESEFPDRSWLLVTAVINPKGEAQERLSRPDPNGPQAKGRCCTKQFVRLEVNKQRAIHKLLSVTHPAQPGALFNGVH